MEPYVYIGGFLGILVFFFIIAWSAEKDRLWPIALMITLAGGIWYGVNELGWKF